MNNSMMAQPVDLGKYGLTDLRAQLVAQLYSDLDPDEGYPESLYYRKLTPPDPDYTAIFVCNEKTKDISDPWYVYCWEGIEYDDAAGAEKQAAALLKAAEQARILNASGRVVEVEDYSAHAVGDTVVLVHRSDFTGSADGPGGLGIESTRLLSNLDGKAPGFTWGDDPEEDPSWFRFELVGRFSVLSASYGPRTNRFVLEEVI